MLINKEKKVDCLLINCGQLDITIKLWNTVQFEQNYSYSGLKWKNKIHHKKNRILIISLKKN